MKRKRIIRVAAALLAVFLWLGFVVDGSHALYTDQVRLLGSGITSTTSNLLISNSQNATSTIFEKERPGFVFNLSPGESVNKFFLIKNASDSGLNFKLALSASLTYADVAHMASYVVLTISEADADGTPVGSQTQVNLATLLTSSAPTNFIVPQGEIRRYVLTTSLDNSYTQQAQPLTYDLNIAGTQSL